MAHQYKLSEWQQANGSWTCGDVEDLANNSNYSWHPCRLLGVTAEGFIKMLVKTFKVNHLKYNLEADVLFFSWNKQSDMRKYKNYINRKAREECFYV